jgi:hypothetical protein
VICPVDEHQWEDINWNGLGHRTCVNTELGTFCRLLYPDVFPVGQPARGCALMDPLRVEAVRRAGLLSGCHGKDVLGKFSR